MLLFDLHMHSYYSFDSLNDPQEIARRALKNGLDGISITDHNVFCIDFQSLQEKYPDLIIIPGTEVGTEAVGDILCYFIKSEITTKDALEVVHQVHEQGGITVLAHPFHHGRTSWVYPDELLKVLDAIETANAHNTANFKQAQELAKRLGKPQTGGSDAHLVSEIGNGITYVNLSKKEAMDKESLKKAILNNCTTKCLAAPFYSFYFSQGVKFLRKIKLINQP